LQLADRMLAGFGSLALLARGTMDEFQTVCGIGRAKAATLAAAFELGRRVVESNGPERFFVRTPGDAAGLVMERMRSLDREHFGVMMLDTRRRLLGVKVVSVGHLSGALVHPRELFKTCIQKSSAAVILVHNHPSGDPTPSQEDVELTRRVREAGEILGIPVLDHLVIGDKRYVSLREIGLL